MKHEEFEHLLPSTFAVETTLACNLRCPECALGGGFLARSRQIMGFDQYRIIADKIRPFAKLVYLHIWGEPLLNKDIFKMIQYTARFARTNISTNGQCVDEKMAEQLIESGVTDIIVSIDGFTQSVYEKYRVGGDVRAALKSLRYMQQANCRHGGRVNITPQFIVFEHNEHEMELFENFCGSLGLKPSFKAPYFRNGKRAVRQSSLPDFQRPMFDNLVDLRQAMSACANPRDVFTILVDGSVVVCCHDYLGLTCFGNIFNADVLDIWNSSKYREFRWSIVSGKAPEFCVNSCMTYVYRECASGPPSPDAGPSFSSDKADVVDCGGMRINLCCGARVLKGYVNIDFGRDVDVVLDLEKHLLPFPDASADALVCMSAINYFSRDRAQEIVRDVFRVLRPGGIARFGTQDLRILAGKYLKQDREFYCQKLPDGRERFPGATLGDKLNEFFYGFHCGDKHCKYVYDFESLKLLFVNAGFQIVEERRFHDSRLADVELIDNRPEQMFFLEAVKQVEPKGDNGEPRESAGDTGGSAEERRKKAAAASRELAFSLLDRNPPRGWQYLLRTLDLDASDRSCVLKCAEILKVLNRTEDITRLCQNFLQLRPSDVEIETILRENRLAQQKKDAQEGRYRERRRELDRLDSRQNNILSDQEHLDACMRWLRRAQEAHPGGGVSAYYISDQERWGDDYPETTGYIIPTFIGYAQRCGNKDFMEWAVAMGDWEISIQSPQGGAGEPFGVYIPRPRVFNTAQVILGWLALFRVTQDTKYLAAAQFAGDWIVSVQDQDGKWVRNTYAGPKAYKSRVAWALLELFAVTNKVSYREAAEKAVRWILDQAAPNGWFSNNSLSDPERPWTHLIGYVLVGLLEICRLRNASLDYARIERLLCRSAQAMSRFYCERKVSKAELCHGLPGTFDSQWDSQDTWSCITGNAQLEFFLRRLARSARDLQFQRVADQLLDDIKRVHLVDRIEDPNIHGGLAGSYPIGAPYASYLILNWAAKFFADGLLQKMNSTNEMAYLG